MRFHLARHLSLTWFSMALVLASVLLLFFLLSSSLLYAQQSTQVLTTAPPVSSEKSTKASASDDQAITHQLSQLIAEANFAEGSILSASAVRLRDLQKLRFTATVVEPLKAAKTRYMQHSIQRLSPEFTADIGHVLQVADAEGNRVFLYVLAELAPAMQTVQADAQLLLTGYHVFDSRHGPGILISEFEQR